MSQGCCRAGWGEYARLECPSQSDARLLWPGCHALGHVTRTCRAILASHSEYFRARVSANWTAANIIQHEGRQVIVERVEPDMVGQAALITGS
jgi:hypothetical protein